MCQDNPCLKNAIAWAGVPAGQGVLKKAANQIIPALKKNKNRGIRVQKDSQKKTRAVFGRDVSPITIVPLGLLEHLKRVIYK